jgi:tRNA (guanine37-N1)-methyltransferase
MKKNKDLIKINKEEKINSFDLIGNIAIVKFPQNFSNSRKINLAKNLLKKIESIKTVIEKKGKIKGRLRKQENKYLAGEKTKEVLYKENNCVFRFNIDDVYFSPRLSNERKDIAKKIKNKEEVLVMFAGVGPFSIVIAKNSNAKKVYSNEINRNANKYAKLNLELNNVNDKIVLLSGDIRKIAEKISKEKLRTEGIQAPSKFDVIIMPRPKLKNTFLKEAFILSKKGTRIFYYDFCKFDEIKEITEKIINEAKKNKKKVKIINIKKAGEIAPYKIRVRVDFLVY